MSSLTARVVFVQTLLLALFLRWLTIFQKVELGRSYYYLLLLLALCGSFCAYAIWKRRFVLLWTNLALLLSAFAVFLFIR